MLALQPSALALFAQALPRRGLRRSCYAHYELESLLEGLDWGLSAASSARCVAMVFFKSSVSLRPTCASAQSMPCRTGYSLRVEGAPMQFKFALGQRRDCLCTVMRFALL